MNDAKGPIFPTAEFDEEIVPKEGGESSHDLFLADEHGFLVTQCADGNAKVARQ